MDDKRGRRRPGEDWGAEEWPAGDWEREEPRTGGARGPATPGAPDVRGRTPDRYSSPEVPRGAGDRYSSDDRFRARPGRPADPPVEGDLSRVVDDPMFDALPGGVPIADSRTAWNRRRDPMSARLSARRAQPTGMSAGAKLLLVVAFAGVAAVAFGAGLLIGASGGKLPWMPASVPGTAPVGEKSAAAASPDSPEGIITFSERGDVPPKVEDEEAPSDDAEAKAKPAPPPESPREAGADRSASKEKPAARKQTARAEGENPEKKAEMTFYDTATGKREVPGLDAEGTKSRDSEAPDDAAAEGTPEPESPPARAQNPPAPREEAPLGSDVLAKRRAAESEQPPVSAPAEPEGTPSGADLLARRRAERQNGAPPAAEPVRREEPPAPATGTYTVQVATLTSRAEAQSLAERLTSKGYDVRLDSLSGASGATLYRVRVGRYTDERAAQRDLDRIREEPGTNPFVKAE